MSMATSCTIPRATGGTCNAPAVFTFGPDDCYGECAEHSTAHVSVGSIGDHRMGDSVVVSRYGKEYPAVVTRVGRRGAAWATFTYKNGATRTVRI